ncbi:MAG TPA: oligosaccharide flippase family protein [Geminicoccus sp.]|uniref:lipopolysaccharide biosynthesis protein n=1 Tax=Geminicoccus sp. TaxID=2024832 RepID=UPI002E33F1EA|nr:oligosaccharide flippase family protein [Geminicoccus sp.]HEX2529563.1 oligosaccharide flippase family protein [Geminicoccus sp.]
MSPVGRHWLQKGRLGRILVYGSSRSIVEAMLGVRGVLLASILGPEAFGIWALFRLTTIYGSFAGLGLLRGLELEVAKAWGDIQRRQAWGRTAAGCIFIVFGIMSGLTCIASLFVEEAWQRQLLLAVAAGLLLERLAAYGLTFMRASGSLSHFALMELVQASAQLVATVTLGYLFGLNGALFGFSAACLVGLLVLPGRVPLRPELHLSRLKSMLAVGLPLSLNSLLAAMLATVDRLVVAAWLGLEALGQYAFAVSVASIGGAAALVVQTVVFPDMYRRLEREGAQNITREHLERTIRPFVLILAPSVGAVALVLGLVVTLVLPRYQAAVQPAAVFVFTGIAQGVVSLAVMAVVAAGRQRFLPLFTVAALVVNALLATGTLALGFGMVGLATGAVVARVCYAGGIVLLIARGTGARPLATAFAILWPIPWCAGASFVIFSLVSPRDFASCGIALVGYLVAVSPVLITLARALCPPRPSSLT